MTAVQVAIRLAGRVRLLVELIKLQHTVFALPFALISMLVAADGLPEPRIIAWILAAMVGARSAAMAFNRIADLRIDAANPRTASRALPRGDVSLAAAWVLTAISSALFVFAAFMLNTLAFALSPVALAAILGYSFSKRFTSLSHLWLGLCLGIAPVGAWIAVTGSFGLPALVLSAAVTLWTAGFDVIYSLQDLEFDRRTGLFSLPARIGAARALLLSRVFHGIVVGLLVWFGVLSGLGWVFYTGVAVAAGVLAYEQSLVSPDDISRVDTAFFTANGCVSIALLVFTAVDVLA